MFLVTPVPKPLLISKTKWWNERRTLVPFSFLIKDVSKDETQTEFFLIRKQGEDFSNTLSDVLAKCKSNNSLFETTKLATGIDLQFSYKTLFFSSLSFTKGTNAE